MATTQPLLIEATVRQRPHGRVHVDVVERFGRPHGAGDARIATHDVSCTRWRDFYHPMYRAATQLAGVSFRVIDRGFPAKPSSPA